MVEGVALIDRAILRHEEWMLERPYSNGQAWLEMILLANQQRGSFKRGDGRIITIEPGQLGWSKVGLADRWGWSQGKVARTISRWQSKGMIRVEGDGNSTLITVCNYVDYQSGLTSLLEPKKEDVGETAVERRGDDGATTVTEREREGDYCTKTEGKGKGNRNHPDLQNLVSYFAGNGSDYTPEEIRLVFLEFEQDAEDGQWQTRGSRPRPVTDWRSAVEFRLAERRRWDSEKNGAKKPVGNTGGVPSWQRVKSLRERLAAAEEAHDALRQSLDDLHPDVKAAWATVQALSEQVRKLEEAQ